MLKDLADKDLFGLHSTREPRFSRPYRILFKGLGYVALICLALLVSLIVGSLISAMFVKAVEL